MALAQVSPDGQITLPDEIRRILKLKSGDHIRFEQQDGRIFIDNLSPTQLALLPIQEKLRNQDDGIDEDDIQALVNEVRYGE